MTIFLNLAIVAYSLLIIFLQCRYQAREFAKNKTISHWGKGLLYTIFILLLTAIMMWGKWDNIWHEHRLWGIPLIGLVTRMAWFDIILNRIRKRVWWYNSTLESGTKGSLIDRWENKLSIPMVKALKVVYIIFFIDAIIFLR